MTFVGQPPLPIPIPTIALTPGMRAISGGRGMFLNSPTDSFIHQHQEAVPTWGIGLTGEVDCGG